MPRFLEIGCGKLNGFVSLKYPLADEVSARAQQTRGSVRGNIGAILGARFSEQIQGQYMPAVHVLCCHASLVGPSSITEAKERNSSRHHHILVMIITYQHDLH